MTFLLERLAELSKHLDHLRSLRPKVVSAGSLEGNLSLHNDVLFSLLTVAQLVVDIAGELSARRGLRFDDYAGAVRNLASLPEFDSGLVDQLARLPGFRNILLHEYVEFDLSRAVAAMDELDPIAEFMRIVAKLESE